jgi:hypothetical protein
MPIEKAPAKVFSTNARAFECPLWGEPLASWTATKRSNPLSYEDKIIWFLSAPLPENELKTSGGEGGI